MIFTNKKIIIPLLFPVFILCQKITPTTINTYSNWHGNNKNNVNEATNSNYEIEEIITNRVINKEHYKNSINRVSNSHPQIYRSLNREIFFSTLVDSSKNGYGYYIPQTNPINYNPNYGFSMIYRKWQGIDESSGYIGMAQSLEGSNWNASYPINENLSDGTPMSSGRYPSIVMADDGTKFAVWNEYTPDCSGGGGTCGRIFFNFNQDTWYQDYPNDDMIDFNNGCAINPCSPEDLWQVQPQLIETEDYWNLYTLSNSWSDESMYFIKTTIQKSTGDYTNTDPLALNMIDNDYNIFKMNPNGEGVITNLTSSNVVEYLITNDFGSTWENKTISEDLLDIEFSNIGYDQETRYYFWNHESHLDSEGGLHIFVGVEFYNDETVTASYFHFYSSIPSNQDSWVINHITDITESYNYNFILPNGNSADESRMYLFPSVSFSSTGNGVIWFLYNKISGYDPDGFADVDIYLSKSENLGVSWTDLGNLTNTSDGYQMESYIHAIPSSTDDFVGFMYGVPDFDISTMDPPTTFADFKQFVYFGFYGDQIVEENDLIITEIMQNPSMVGDDSGEWFEIFNRGNTPISIMGWTIKDDGDDSHVIENNLIISSNEYMVLGNNPDQVTNGGVILDYHYSDISLGNGLDELLLVKPDGTIVNIVAWDNGTTFPDPNGASMALIDISLDNNLGENWQESTTVYGDGDYGTPGVPNFSSDIDVDLTIIDFDTVLVGEPLERILNITNIGNATLFLDSIYTSTSLFTVPVTETSVENSFDLTVTFSPSNYGFSEDTLVLVSNDPDESSLEIPLVGFGYLPSPNIILESSDIDFGVVMDGLNETRDLYVFNNGEAPLLLSSVYIEGSSNFTIENYDDSIAESDTGSIEIKFSPDDEISFNGTLVIISNDPDTGMLTVNLSGVGGEQAPVLLVSNEELYFGPVQSGATVEKELIIYNEGVLDLEIDEIIIDSSDFFTTTFSDATIQPADSVVVPFSFSPTEQVTEVIAFATIASNAGAQTVVLKAGYFGPVWHITTNGSDETGDGTLEHPFETIQKGVNASAGGDTVLVSEGTYIGNISINKEINLIGEHPVSTMLDGNNDGYIITIEEQTNQNIDIDNFTLKNGNGGITNLSQSGNLKISNTILHNNNQYTISHSSSDSLLLSNVTVSNNANGWGVVIGTLGGGHLDIKNSIIYNEFDQGILLGYYAAATASIQYSNILGGESSIITNVGEGGTYEWGDGNIDVDPLFCGVDNYSLAENSPAVGSGEDGTDMGALGIGCEAISPSRIYVGTTGSDETGNGTENNPFATIQKGVDESDEGDTVLVDSGTYFEFVDITDKRITLSSHLSLYPDSLDLISNTIISGISNDFGVINISYDVDSDDLVYPLGVKGFTISNGVGFGCEIGEGIMFSSSNTPLIVQNCVMISNDEDNCNISSRGDVIINKVTMRKLAIVGDPSWHVIANNSIIYGGILELGVDSPNIYDISYSLLPSFWEGEGNIVADPLFCDSMNGDFLLAENSPAVGSGENGTNMGALGIGCEAIDLNLSEIYQIPSDYALHQNYPNPFNPTTQIRYDLPEDQFVSVTIYNVMGHKIRTLINLNQPASYHSIKWDAKNDIGEGVSAGMYIYVIQAGEFKATKKMLLLK